MLSFIYYYAECCYDECHYVECHGAYFACLKQIKVGFALLCFASLPKSVSRQKNEIHRGSEWTSLDGV
jgi:hypothetical protein